MCPAIWTFCWCQTLKSQGPPPEKVPSTMILSKAIHQDPNLPVKYIIYMFSDICSESKELAIYSVENCLKEISFPWIFTIKKIKQLKTNRKKKIQFFVSEKKTLKWLCLQCCCLSHQWTLFVEWEIRLFTKDLPQIKLSWLSDCVSVKRQLKEIPSNKLSNLCILTDSFLCFY